MDNEQNLGTIIIGSDFGGIYMLHKPRNELGLETCAFKRDDGVDGVWYFDRYPGAKSGTEDFVYRYSLDKGLLQGWDQDIRYLEQADIETYLNHVVDRYNLRRDIQINTEVTSTVFDKQHKLWQIRANIDEAFTCRYLVTTLDPLAESNTPDIPRYSSLAGRVMHTNA